VWVAAIVLGTYVSFSALELTLQPWFGFCQWITPEAWQTRGNVLLGLLWLATGITVYGVVLSILPVAIMGTRAARSAGGDLGSGEQEPV